MLPLVLEQLLSFMVGLADALMVASVGNIAVSAVSLVDSVSVLMIVILSALANGGGAVVGQYLGRRETGHACSAATLLLLLLTAVSVVFTLLLYTFHSGILGLLFGRAEEAIRIDCRVYYMILMISVPMIALYSGASSVFRIYGDSRTPLRISLLMNAVNIAGNAVCIYGLKMGVAGAAIPSVLSRLVGMVLIMLLLKKHSWTAAVSETMKFAGARTITGNIITIGVPTAIENGMFQIGKIALMSLISTLSTASITANAIGNTVGNLHCVIGMGVNIGLTTIVSRCVGAGKYDQARAWTLRLMRSVYILQGLVTALLMLAMPVINQLYHVSGEAANLSTAINLIHGGATILFWPIAFMLNSSMAAAGDSRYAMLVSAGAMWVGRVALSFILILGFHFGVLSVWIAWIVDWFIRMAFFIPRWKGHRWETKGIRSDPDYAE